MFYAAKIIRRYIFLISNVQKSFYVAKVIICYLISLEKYAAYL